MAEETLTRDSLAKERTHLANERTVLAYMRTALAFILSGGLILRFDHTLPAIVASYAAIAIGSGVAVFGAKRFIRSKKRIHAH